MTMSASLGWGCPQALAPSAVSRVLSCAFLCASQELEQTGGSYVNMLWLLLRLRQACNHPWLVHGTSARYGGPGAASPSKALGSPGGKVSYSQLAAAKKLAGQLCEQLLQTLQQEPSVCAQCGDISEDAVVSACHHVFCRQCITTQVGTHARLTTFRRYLLASSITIACLLLSFPATD